MIEISQNIFKIVLSGFNKLWTEKIDESKIDFKSHLITHKRKIEKPCKSKICKPKRWVC